MKTTWFFTCLIFIFERGHANTENRTQNETDDPCEDFQVFFGDFRSVLILHGSSRIEQILYVCDYEFQPREFYSKRDVGKVIAERSRRTVDIKTD